jgi:hypothetical protein
VFETRESREASGYRAIISAMAMNAAKSSGENILLPKSLWEEITRTILEVNNKPLAKDYPSRTYTLQAGEEPTAG